MPPALAEIKNIKISGHLNLFSGGTIVPDEHDLLFQDANTSIVLAKKSVGQEIEYKAVQSTRILDESGTVQLLKHEDIRGQAVTARYVHNVIEHNAIKMAIVIDEKLQTDHILKRSASIYLADDKGNPPVIGKLTCKGSQGEAFTFGRN